MARVKRPILPEPLENPLSIMSFDRLVLVILGFILLNTDDDPFSNINPSKGDMIKPTDQALFRGSIRIHK